MARKTEDIFEEFGRRIETQSQKSIELQQQKDRAEAELSKWVTKISTMTAGTTSTSKAIFAKEIDRGAALQQQLGAVSTRFEQQQERELMGSQKWFEGRMVTAMSDASATSARVSAAKDISNYRRISQLTYGTTTHQLSEMRQQTLQDREYMSEQMLAESKGLTKGININTPEGRAQLKQRQDQMRSYNVSINEYDKEIGIIEGSIGQQRRLGLDPQSNYEKILRKHEGVLSDRNKTTISSDVTSGKYQSQEAVTKEVIRLNDELVRSFKKLSEAQQNGVEDLTDLNTAYQETSKKYEEQKQILREMKDQGVGGSGSGKWGERLQTVGAIAMGAGELYRHAAITTEMQQVGNRIGFAELNNRRFNDVYEATQWNYAAGRRVMQDTYGQAVKWGETFYDRENIAGGIDVTGGTAMTAANAMEGYGKGGIGGALTGGLRSGISTVKSGISLGKGIEGQQSLLQRANLEYGLSNAVNAINDMTGQMGLDYIRGVGTASRGLGSSRGGINKLFDADTIKTMNQAGISTNDIPQLLSAGKGAMGGLFNISNIEKAGLAAQKGLTDSSGQYFNMLNMLSNTGGKQDNLENILAKAVTAGMDNSKNIMQMVEATAQLSQKNVITGFSSVSGISDAMARIGSTLGAAGVNPNMRSAIGVSTLEGMDRVLGSGDVTFGKMARMGELRSLFPKMDLTSRMAVSQLTAQQIETMRGMKGEERTKYAGTLGIAAEYTTDENLRKLTSAGITELTGNAIGMPGNWDKIKQATIKGDFSTLSDEDRRAASYYFTKQGININAMGAIASGTGKNISRQNTDTRSGIDLVKGALGEGNRIDAFESMNISSAIATGKLTSRGVGQSTPENMATLSNATANLDPAKYAEQTRQAAENFALSTTTINKTFNDVNENLKKFGGILADIVDKVGAKSTTFSEVSKVNLTTQAKPYQGLKTER